MDLLKILILSIVQGAAELLPVSSSAHVIVAEKIMGLDPTAPAMTLLLVMLHTGTMFAVIAYFWKDWRLAYFSSMKVAVKNGVFLLYATLATGVVGLSLQKAIKYFLPIIRQILRLKTCLGIQNWWLPPWLLLAY